MSAVSAGPIVSQAASEMASKVGEPFLGGMIDG